ncbi:MAG: hypothetical protein ACREE6_04140, partial [Limisphaerales bacterium]
LENQTLDKLSRAPGRWFKSRLPTGAGDGSAQLRPLLDDLLRSEWVFEMRTAPTSQEYALAIRLDKSRMQFWETNLRAVLESWTGIKAQDIAGGWELKKDLPPNLIRAVDATNWLIVACGQDKLPLSDAWAGGQSPVENETNWLSANINWPRLAQIFPVFAQFDLPAMHLQLVGHDGNLLPTGTFELSKPLPALGQWQVPMDMIHQPLTSFTAARGFAPWLELQRWAKWLELSPEPDQAFIWSLGLSPIQTFIAVPVTNGVTALAQLADNLTTDTNWENCLMTPFALVRTTNRLALPGVPFVKPEVRALTDPAGDFLFADVFPNLAPGSAPPGLLEQLNRTNLVFYHWEITSKRLKALPQLTQLALLMTRRRQLTQGSAAENWLSRIGPTLGDSATEVIQTGPTELSFRRSAPAGLTAIELIALGEWLEAPNFPGCDMSLPVRHPARRHHVPKKIKGSLPRLPQTNRSSSNRVSQVPKKP